MTPRVHKHFGCFLKSPMLSDSFLAKKQSELCVWLFGSFGGCTVSKEEGRGRLAWGVWSREEQ